MHPVELALRAAALGQLFILLGVILSGRKQSALLTPLALLLAGIGGYVAAPIAVDYGLPSALSYPLIALGSAIPPLFWYFSSHLFDDQFQLRPWVIVLGLLTLVIALLAYCDYATGSRCTGSSASVTYWLSVVGKFLWVGAAFVVIARDWHNDLVEQRRQLRRLLLSVVGAYILVVMVIELFIAEQTPLQLELVNLVLALSCLTALSIALLRTTPDHVFARIPPPTTEADIDDASSPLARRLVASMTVDRIYAREQLTISTLAQHLNSTPRALRQVINGELGHRNFNTFINEHRVREIAQRMQSPEHHNTPILTLALDAGFRSMAPFNRAFKAVFGITPSEYRASL